MVSYPKTKYWRSKKHLQSVASLPCQNCGLEGQTQAAHSNLAKHGKGRSIKASDEYTAALCCDCHQVVDASHLMTNEMRQQIWYEAFRMTVNELQYRGLWSLDAPTPQIDN